MDHIVLGLYDGPSGGAALLRDGALLAIAEEDRISRRTGVAGLPRAAVQTVLHATALPPDRIRAVVVATESATYAEGVGGERRLPLLVRVSESIPSPAPLGRMIRDSFAAARRRRIDEALRSEFGISCPVRFLDHHLAHAVGASIANGCPDSLAITMDRGADGMWASVISFEQGRPQRIAGDPGSASVLAFLECVADQLSVPEGPDRFVRLEELAARGSHLHYEQLAPYVTFHEGFVRVDESVLGRNATIIRVRTSARKEDVAASALTVAGEAVRRFCTHWYVRSDHERLALGGDLFELPSMVRAVLEAPEVRGVRVAPAPGDSGLPLAAAFAACLPDFLPAPQPLPDGDLPSPFVGISYTDETIGGILARESAEYHLREDIHQDVARILAEGRTIARFHGPAEIGNLGLGNRAILRSPEGESLRKGRLGFALPSGAYHAMCTREAFADLFYADAEPAVLRNQPVPVEPVGTFPDRFPDLMGFGGKVRVHVVDERTNPDLHRVLTEFAEWSGVALLAAAPFRLPNEPLVSSPRDALRTFRLLGADYAAIGHYLVRADHEPASKTLEPTSVRG
ncbi:MAG: carbamoyltransferase C-terminal domain-containing protein [bacterium]